MSEMKKALGERIRLCRKKREMTLQELAEQIGMTKSALSKVERGTVSITSDNLLAISLLFNVSLDWLMKGETWGQEAEEERPVTDELLLQLLNQLSPEEKQYLASFIKFTLQRRHRWC